MRRTEQMWLIGGFLAIVLLVAGGWFLVISPKLGQADEVQATADESAIQVRKLNKEAVALAQQEKQKPAYLARLRTKQAALPVNKSMTTFVRQLQDSGSALDVDVSGLTVGSPIQSALVPEAAELPVNLTASATAANLSRFYTRLQTGQPRAVMIRSISIAADKGSGDTGTTLLASITLSVFCLQDKTNTGVDACELPQK